MNDLQIEYFLAVVKHMNISKAANEKFVTQPAISRHIAILEEELGVTLFKRENRGMTLTKAGNIFADYFKSHQKNISSLKQMVKEIDESQKEYLRIGCGNSWNLSHYLPYINKEMKKQYPNMEMIIENYSFEELAYALNEGKIDVAIGLEQSMYELATIELQNLTKISRVLLYSKNNEVVEKDQKPQPFDFKNQNFFSSIDESSIIGLMNSYCKPYGFVPKVKIVNNADTLYANVINGFGVTIVDQWTPQINTEPFQYIILNSEHLVSLAWKKNNNSIIVMDFINKLKKKMV